MPLDQLFRLIAPGLHPDNIEPSEDEEAAGRLPVCQTDLTDL